MLARIVCMLIQKHTRKRKNPNPTPYTAKLSKNATSFSITIIIVDIEMISFKSIGDIFIGNDVKHQKKLDNVILQPVLHL